MSIHECPVIKVKLEKHPNADKLSLVKTEGYTLVVRTDEWHDEELGVHIPPDYVCPDRPEFSFLGSNKRVRPQKLRGVVSDGILIKAPPGSSVGENMMEKLGIVRYESVIPLNSRGDNESGPGIYTTKYDIENYKKYHTYISSSDDVVISEKLHGANARFVFHKDKMYCGSRANWKKYSPTNLWWRALYLNPWIEGWCVHHPDHILYGEVYGQVQNLKYGTGPNEIKFAVFDILYKGEWIEYDEAKQMSRGCDWVPELYSGQFNEELAFKMAEENSSIKEANHHREGVVIQVVPNRFCDKIGRIKLKIVGNKYLNKDV